MSICITKISTPSMARVKERLNNNTITKNFTDVVVQIILTLILFSKVTNATCSLWPNGLYCFGSPYYTVTFENHLSKDDPTYDMKKNKMTITCYADAGAEHTWPNPTGCFGFCDNGVQRTYRCVVTLKKSSWRKEFIAFGDFCNDCKKEVDGCQWQIRKDHVFLYSPTKKKYVQYEYLPGQHLP